MKMPLNGECELGLFYNANIYFNFFLYLCEDIP